MTGAVSNQDLPPSGPRTSPPPVLVPIPPVMNRTGHTCTCEVVRELGRRVLLIESQPLGPSRKEQGLEGCYYLG